MILHCAAFCLIQTATADSVHSFTARLSQDTEGYYQQKIVIGDVIDAGDDSYDATTGIYRAPESGLYLFALTVRVRTPVVRHSSTERADAEIVAAGDVVCSVDVRMRFIIY